MPALPTVKPTLQEFIEQVSEKYGITRESLGVRLISPLQDIDPHLALEPRVLSRMCDDLQISYEEFALDPEKLADFNFGTYQPDPSD